MPSNLGLRCIIPGGWPTFTSFVKVANAASCNANQDPNKPLIDAMQCQAQGRSNCSSAGWNNVQCSMLFDDENCKKAWECGLKTTAPQ